MTASLQGVHNNLIFVSISIFTNIYLINSEGYLSSPSSQEPSAVMAVSAVSPPGVGANQKSKRPVSNKPHITDQVILPLALVSQS